MAVTLNASTSTGLVQSADTSGIIQLQSNGTTALTVNTNEGVQILNCLGVGNATPSTSGAGITFPASQSASTDANTLDDYEEGTWTVAIQGSSTNPTVSYNFRYATYVKVGRLVTLNFHLRTSSVAGGSGDVWITGLPFSVDNTSSYTTVGAVYQFGTNGNYSTFARLDNGSTHLDLYYGSYNVQATQFAVSDLATGSVRNETAVTISYLATA
jgi:hypothetical protein